MGSILDTLPFDYSQQAARDLRDLLANLYFDRPSVLALADAAGIPRSALPFGDDSISTWHQLLWKVRNRNQLWRLIEQVLRDPDAAPYHPRIEELIADRPVVSPPGSLLEEHAPAAGDEDELRGLERQTGERPTLV